MGRALHLLLPSLFGCANWWQPPRWPLPGAHLGSHPHSPTTADVFSIVPLSFNEWLLVLLYAMPVMLIDEVLKLVGRHVVNRRARAGLAAGEGPMAKDKAA